MTTPRLTDAQTSEIQQWLNEQRPEYQRLTSPAGQRQRTEARLKTLQRLQQILTGATMADAVLALGRLKEALRPIEEVESFISAFERDRDLLSQVSAG